MEEGGKLGVVYPGTDLKVHSKNNRKITNQNVITKVLLKERKSVRVLGQFVLN